MRGFERHLLFSGRCIHRRFLRSLRLISPRLGLRLLPLLTVAVPPLWCFGCRSKLRRPPPLPLPSRIGSGGDARARRPFRRPPAVPAATVANDKVPGKSPPDGVSPQLRVGGCLSAHWRHWQTIGAESWMLSVVRDGYRILFKDSPPALARTPISFPNYRTGSPQSLVGGRKDVVQGCL